MNPITNHKLATALFAGVWLVLAAIFPAAANSAYTWTSTGASPAVDGAGTWDTSGSKWLLNGSGTATAWVNSPVQDAVIGNNSGAAGTITLGANLTVGNITFAAPGSSTYTIASNSPSTYAITLSGTPTITVNAAQATISAPLGGSFAVNASAGENKLYLAGNETFTGTITVNGGTLDLKGFIGGAVLPNATAIVINSGGTLWNEFSDKPATYNCGYAVTINPGGTFTQKYGGSSAFLGGGTGASPSITLAGGTFDATTAKQPSNIGFNITADSTLGSAANNAGLSFSGSAWTLMNGTRQLTVNAPMTNTAAIGDGGHGYRLTLAGSSVLALGATETYTGPTTINSGTLVLNASGVLNAASGVAIAAGGTLDVSAQTTWTAGSSASPAITASGTGTAATIKGGTTVSFGSRPITLNYDGLHDTMLTISQGALTMNGNTVTINGSSTLSLGTHNIIQVTGGSITLAGTIAVSGTAIPAGSVATVSTSGGTPNYVTLNLQTPPAITGPNNQSFSAGSTVTISASVMGYPTPVLQWRVNGTNLADGLDANGSTIAGSATSTLFITNAQAADAGTYALVATNSAGKATNSMSLTYGSSAPTISGLTNQTVLAGNNATLNATVLGSPTPSVQWYVSPNGGTSSNAIAGATSTTLTLTNVQYAQNNYIYYLLATNSAGMATSNLTLTVQQIAPTITGLTNQIVDARFNATFGATVGGAPMPALQWNLNGMPITGATNAALTLTNIQLLQNGYVYSLTATNTAGITTSNLTLTVTNALFNVQLNSYATTYTGLGQIGAASDKWNNPTLSGVNGTVYSSNAPPTTLASGISLVDNRGVSSPVTFSMTGSNFVYNTGGTVSGNGVVAGLNDHFLKFDYTGKGTPVATVSLAGLPPSTSLNLFGYGAIAYGGAGGTWAFSSTNGGASAVIGWPAGTSSAMDLTQATNQGNCWMKITGTTDSGGNLTVKVTPNAGGDWWQVYLNGLQVQLHTQPLVAGLTNLTIVQGNSTTLTPTITGTPAPAFQWQTNGVNISGATNSSLALNNVQYTQNGYVYSLISTNMAGTVTNSMTLTVIVTPSITGLANQAITVTSNTIISTTISGVPTPTLQWQFNNTNLTDGLDARGSTISGSVSSSLSISNAQIADTGTYSLIASNSAGIVTNSMTLTVSSGNVAPGITGPANQTAIQGSNAMFTASVSGLPVPTLQWFDQTGAPIAGATSSTLTLTNVSYSQNGFTYSLVASNSAGMATNGATLTVLVPASIATQPQNLTVTNMQSASFSVVAGGVPAPAYQWYFNGSVIPAATAATYNIAGAAPTNTGNYTVVVVNSVNAVTSSVAALTVNSTMGYTSLTPSNGATGVCYDTPLYINFTIALTLRASGTIKIYNATNPVTPADTIDLSQCVTNNSTYAANVQPYTIGGQTFTNFPVIISGNTAAIYPHQGLLTSNQTYYVTMDNGTFTDGNGAYFAGITATNAWRFTTKVGGPFNATNLVVAQDYSGDYATVQGAVNYVASGNTAPTVINIRNGAYTEIVNVNSRNKLDLRGQSRNGTVVGYPNNNNLNAGAPWRSCFVLNGNDCTLETLTLTNLTPVGGSQAEAIDVEGTRAILYNIELDSHQDTFLVHSAGKLVYFQDSLVQGDTDFNWGYGTVYYTNCEIRCVTAGGLVTQPRSPYMTNGFGFINCRITKGYAGNSAFYLGRTISTPTTPAEVLFANCLMDDVVTGYASDAGTNMADYACSNLTATVTKSLTYSTHSISSDPYVTAIQSATNWLYGWQPALAPNVVSQPAGQSASNGQLASFAVSATGIPSPTYQWLLNGLPVAGATNATFAVASAARTNGGNYSVVVTNGSGSVTSSVAQLTYINTAPVAQTMTVTRTAGLSLHIAWSDVATNWSDVDGDTVTLSGINLVTTNAVNLVTNSSWIFYTNSLNVNDQFSYGISDGQGGTNIGFVNIVVNGSFTGTNSIAAIVNNGASMTVKAYGIPAYNYILERATNLAPAVWVDISTNAAATNGMINAIDNFNDLGNVPPGSAYYRLKWQP
jgi:autotransporter-associated beta strand protein